MGVKDFFKKLTEYCDTVPASKKCMAANNGEPCKFINICGSMAYWITPEQVDQAIADLNTSLN